MEPEMISAIKADLRKSAEDFFNSIVDEEIRKLFKEHAFIAGGAIASLILGETPNDYDFYIDDSTVCYKIVQYFLRNMDSDVSIDEVEQTDIGISVYVPHGICKVEATNDKYQPLVVTANAISFSDGVQVIMRYTGNPNELAKNFDFLHSKGIYMYKRDELILSPETQEAIQNKRLIYTGSDYPLASLIRTRKFVSRGWKINAGQYLKIALDLNKLQLSDPQVLREQLVGVDLLHYANFLEKLASVGIENIDFDHQTEDLFSLIDDAFDVQHASNVQATDLDAPF
ncbi:hypothetical protein [Paenibacillus polymyxa]|uniref:hypothetical protein n=1 Tax=Paenibacillus polymyxa TaxID=1406 RepID=UPI0001E6D6B8|nr:hypothetical protein [Paenibacillus polymyxa]WPQ59873.1 hypothetical protein SKN87_26665 [Paenibacillus polymyxa]